jgi:hypothetical protein
MLAAESGRGLTLAIRNGPRKAGYRDSTEPISPDVRGAQSGSTREPSNPCALIAVVNVAYRLLQNV